MQKPAIQIAISVLAIIILSGCKSQKSTTGQADKQAAKFNVESLAHSNNLFTIDLFRQIQTKSDNLIFSPYSIGTVLAMIYSGSGGKTKAEMSEVLYFPSPDRLDPAESVMKEHILAMDTMPGTDIRLANAIWAQQDFSFSPEYLDRVKQYYDAPLTLMDFIQTPNREENRKKINQWVEKNTNYRIKDLIQPGVLDASTRMVLTNAIYFNGAWMFPFEEGATSPSLFHVSRQENMTMDFMHQTSSFPYYEDEEVQAISLPYKNGRMSLMVILPKSIEGWKIVSQVINYERITLVRSAMKSREVQLVLPKFRSELLINLRQELTAMGMGTVFSRYADLSGMTGEKNLYVDEVIHKAFIEVNESGTEAAAATAGIIGLKSSLAGDPVRFIADHPFIFFLFDQQTACIIFTGRFVRPS
ncbi:MAG: serpin family protein [Bacteroidales bacterium]|nr:serpin family protein [Bacteroidales bacterium]